MAKKSGSIERGVYKEKQQFLFSTSELAAQRQPLLPHQPFILRNFKTWRKFSSVMHGAPRASDLDVEASVPCPIRPPLSSCLCLSVWGVCPELSENQLQMSWHFASKYFSMY